MDIHSEAKEDGKEESLLYVDSVTIEKNDEDCNTCALQRVDLCPVVVIKREDIAESVNNDNSISNMDSVQVLRRSLRIQKINAQRNETNASLNNVVPPKTPISCNARKANMRAKSAKKTCKKKKVICDDINTPNKIAVRENQVPKCVTGILNKNGMDMVLIEWQDGRRSYVPKTALTERMKKLLKTYLSMMLQDYSNDCRPSVRLQDETTSRNLDLETNHDFVITNSSSCNPPSNSMNDEEFNSNNLKQEKSSIHEFKRLQMACMINPQLLSDLGLNDPQIDIKLEL